MKSHYLRTTDIAYAVAVHPNTVRMYEAWGLLPTIPRTLSGYRQFTEKHLDQMRFARSVMHFTWLGGDIRHTAYDMIKRVVTDDLGGALELAYQILVMIQSERVQADAATALLERWAKGTATDATTKPLRIGQVAELLNVTRDMLRNWERNGLVKVPRNPRNGYRIYGQAEIGRLRVIRTLRHARYSTMAILRMLTQLDQGQRDDLRSMLDTPHPDEDVYYATDQWLSTLSRLEPRAEDLIAQLEAMIAKQSSATARQQGWLKLGTQFPGGRATVVKQFADILEKALACIAPFLHTDDYRLYGTAAALLQGVFLPTHDINILVRTNAHVDRCADALHAYPCLNRPTLVENAHIYRSAHLIQGLEVTITCFTNETTADGIETVGPGPWEHCVEIPCGQHTIRAVALEVRLATELYRERRNRYRPIMKYLKKHGCDLPLLRQSMDARHLGEAQQRDVLQHVAP